MSEINLQQTESSSNRQRILITGVSGLIGRILFNHLTNSSSNKYEVFGLDQHLNTSSRYYSHECGEQTITTILSIPLDKFFPCDVTNRTELHRIIEEQNIDIIVHLAAVLESCPDIDKITDVNVQGTRNIFEAPGVRRVIYASSVRTVFGYLTREPYLSISNDTFDDATMLSQLRKLTVREDPPCTDEETPGTKAYGQSKILGEQMANDAVQNNSKSIICVRLGWVNITNEPGDTWLRTVWFSYRDLCAFIDKALAAPLNISGTYFGISNNHRLWVDLEDAKRDLGYVPQDGAKKIA